MKNIGILKGLVETQYNDMEGLISIDQHADSDLFRLCEDNGIDMNYYFLFGFGLSEFTITGIGYRGEVYCSVLLIEKEKYGQTFDNIASKTSSVDPVDVIKKSFRIKYEELGKYIKRFNFMVVSELSNYIQEINIQE
jgi:hypothetical protein